MNIHSSHNGIPSPLRWIAAAAFAVVPVIAQASLLPPALENALADGLSWAVLVIAPITVIILFWLVHILPEKIAEKKKHPQAKAIQCLCLLSLAFGGMLWPLAWLWAYSKPVMYKLAYGTDKVPHGADDAAHAPVPDESAKLRLRIAELETQLAGKAGNEKKA